MEETSSSLAAAVMHLLGVWNTQFFEFSVVLKIYFTKSNSNKTISFLKTRRQSLSGEDEIKIQQRGGKKTTKFFLDCLTRIIGLRVLDEHQRWAKEEKSMLHGITWKNIKVTFGFYCNSLLLCSESVECFSLPPPHDRLLAATTTTRVQSSSLKKITIFSSPIYLICCVQSAVEVEQQKRRLDLMKNHLKFH